MAILELSLLVHVAFLELWVLPLLEENKGCFKIVPVHTVQKHQFHEKQACVGKLSCSVARQVKSLVFINLKLGQISCPALYQDYMSWAGPVSRAGVSLPGSRQVC